MSLVTQRKPASVSFETWVERQIREATERGAFEDLPGAGKPIPGLDAPHDEHWWIKQKMRSEGLSFLPPSLALRKEVTAARAAALAAESEAEARRIVADVNEKVREAIRRPLAGPRVELAPLDVERVLAERRAG